MKPFSALLIFCCVNYGGLLGADIGQQAWELERKGDAGAARELLARSAKDASSNATDLIAYAQFLDWHGDSGAREAYERALRASHGAEKAPVARRLVELDLLAGDRTAAARDLGEYRATGDNSLQLPPASLQLADKQQTVPIPGPLRSFSRMAALAPDLSPEDVMPALARNVVTNGYQAASSNEALEQTEYLKLVVRYLSQAREIEKLAGPEKVIKIETCDSTMTGDLLRVLGYRIRGACGSDVVLETVNASRAFLTIDSGFPLAELEQSLRTNRPFVYDYKPALVPVLYGSAYWLTDKESQGGDFLDFFLGDPSLCRLYLGMSKLDPETAADLRKKVSVEKLRAFSHVLDFYGGMFEIRNGKAITPGGARTARTWGELAGASPENGANFYEHLIAKDDGWLASYYDALARIDGPVQTYLTEPERLKRFYGAIRGKVTSPGPARPVFRANTDMLLLTARLRMDANGRPYLPGGLDVWRNLFAHHPHGKYDAKLAKSAANWKDPDDVLEALFGLCRKSVENEPLKIFMTLTDVDAHRTEPLSAATADRMARAYRQFGAQYPIFSEVPEVSNATINKFLDVAESANQIHDQSLRADVTGSVQALTSLWQILYRQRSIPASEADSTLSNLLTPFSAVKDEQTLFDSSRADVKLLLAAAHSPASALPQDRMFDLLAGNGSSENPQIQTQLVEEMMRIFEAQRLVSLNTLFDLADNLDAMSKGEKANTALVNKMAARISEIQLPRETLSGMEKSSLSFGYWSEKHIDAQRKLNLRAIIDRASADPKKIEGVRGLLAPFLRDTLVGLNYIYYAPPGAQILLTNPLFVRSHDFVGMQGINEAWRETEVQGSGWPTSAGGKLVGSLAGLPYALAEAEQNFLIPSREQALIWGDLVPQILVSATVQRWWRVSPAQMHWVALHMRLASALLAESSLNANRRREFLDELSLHAPPVRVARVRKDLEEAMPGQALEELMPSEMFTIARETIAADKAGDQPIAEEIRRIEKESPEEVNYAVISREFGTPKPTLANSYAPQLLGMRTFPALMGYSSRILAESWESSLLYYATIADAMHLQPAELNIMIPEWTEQTVEQIFATHLEDWPALLRSLRVVGQEALEKNHKQVASLSGSN